MTERELETEVRRLIKGYGLLAYHPYDSRRSEKGWPDWVIVGKCRLFYRELKSQVGALTGPQRHWGYALQAAGQDWAVWRPEDYWSGRIARELEGLATGDV